MERKKMKRGDGNILLKFVDIYLYFFLYYINIKKKEKKRNGLNEEKKGDGIN